MKFMTFLTLCALLFSCGKNAAVDSRNKADQGFTSAVNSNEEVSINISGKETEIILNSNSFDQKNGVLKFRQLDNEQILELLNEEKVEINVVGLEKLHYDNFEISEYTASLSSVLSVNEDKKEITKEQLRKIISLGVKVEFEKIKFKVNEVEVIKKFEQDAIINKSGSFDNIDELRNAGAKRFIERFYVTKRSPVFEKFTKNGKIVVFTISGNIFGASKNVEYVTANVKKVIGFDFFEVTDELDGNFEISSLTKLTKEFEIKTALREFSYRSLKEATTAKVLEIEYEFNKNIPNGKYVEFNDGTSSFLTAPAIEYAQELKIKREIIPLYY